MRIKLQLKCLYTWKAELRARFGRDAVTIWTLRRINETSSAEIQGNCNQDDKSSVTTKVEFSIMRDRLWFNHRQNYKAQCTEVNASKQFS